ncbi:ATP-dependent RNA helicase DHX29 isoform B [Alligator mississippiensis]|uniref:RNA helicase n=1 Tax=Alligator mississippiensis TaxID=8496 RepID=A0A151MX81_ALLMI|nr:ATP-dependent RNA helicase DHX29 isoform B [Alligator mississippiensis]
MGGKSKKHRGGAGAGVVHPAVSAATAAARARAAAEGGGAAGEAAAKRQAPRPAPACREPRVKQGPKTYSFGSSTDSSGAVSNQDKSVLKVVINSNLEKRIIGVINEHKKQYDDKGMISRRLTAKKLQDVYMALQGFSFKTEHIEEAMKNTILYGGDLHSALDWLCLNLSDDALPEGFSQQFEEEQHKPRAKFYSPVPQCGTHQMPNNRMKEGGPEIKQKNTGKDKELSMKEWILQYAEQQSDDEKNESVNDLEYEEKFDPNERYLHLAAKLSEAKEQASSSKQDKDKQGQKAAQEKIRRIQQEMSTLEEHPVFNPDIKIANQQQNEMKKPPLSSEAPLNLSLLEKSGAVPQEQKVKKKEPLDVRNFDYSARSWTGKSPKQFLIDWCRKYFSKSPNPSFEKVPVGRYWKCRVRITKSADDIMTACPTIVTEDSMQAQHLAATLALYHLVKGQSVHQLLPPTYRDVWLEWTVSLATRVCEELGCEAGPGGKNSLCGYQIRMESRTGEATRLLYCTTGVLLRKLQEDGLLSNVSHVIVDEVHERSVQSDFLLIILKEILHKRSDLHLILMSATVDSEKFSSYFSHCPILRISGRSYPVEVFHVEDVIEEIGYVLEKDSEYCQKFLEEEEEITINVTKKGGEITKYQEYIPLQSGSGVDVNSYYQKYSSCTQQAIFYMNPYKINLDLILELLAFLDRTPQFKNVEGAVLIFLPGLAHIQQLYDLISTDRRFNLRDRHRLIALHSILSTQDQAAAFTIPPPGIRKIVLATNIAETGITIPDVVFVIDTGRTKENRYHESSQMSSLEETFVSKASALQRQGRAGRVRDGFCFRMYTKDRFESFMEYSVPEILRVPLEELCLHIMKCNLGAPEDFLSRALDPPQPQVISNAMNLLRKIGACELIEPRLTPLGQHLAALPVNVKIGKMLIFGAIFGCLDPVATLAAVMTEKSPFTTPIGRKDEADLAKSSLALANSDHLTIYNAYLGWKKARQEGGYRTEMTYCRRNFLNRTSLLTLEDVKQELIKVVRTAGFATPATKHGWDGNGSTQTLSLQEIALLKSVLTAGLYDNVGKIMYTKSVDVTEKLSCMVETAQGKAQVHPSSVNRDLQTYGWLLYQEKIRYARIYLRETTLISPFPVLLFGGDIEVQHRERLLSVDGWIHFQAPVKIAVIFKQLRVLIESVLKKKLENPKMSLEDDKILHIIKELIKTES